MFIYHIYTVGFVRLIGFLRRLFSSHRFMQKRFGIGGGVMGPVLERVVEGSNLDKEAVCIRGKIKSMGLKLFFCSSFNLSRCVLSGQILLTLVCISKCLLTSWRSICTGI